MSGRIWWLAAIALLWSAKLGAQASSFVVIGEWTTPYLEHLIRTGVIADPDPLTRPLKRDAVIAALRKADTLRASRAVRATVRRLTEYYAPVETPIYRADFHVGVVTANHARRDPLREAGKKIGTLRAGARLSAVFGPFAIGTMPEIDGRLRRDPDYRGQVDDQIPFPGRISDAYLSAQGKYGEFTFGILQRNWGPTGIDGALVSPEPYGYEHMMASLGTTGIRVEALVTQLDDFINPNSETVNRWWATQRVMIRPAKWMRFAITQASLWDGVGRQLEFRWLNPLRLSALNRIDENLPDSINSLHGMDLWLKLPHRVTFQGSLMVDDLAGLPPFGTSVAPNRLTATAVVEAPIPSSSFAAVRLMYTVVTNLAYRAPKGPREAVMLHGIGLGRNFSDYTQLTLSSSLLPLPMLTVTPEITVLRQGEGDFRLPWPGSYTGVPTLFAGTIERTVRLGMAAQVQVIRNLDADLNGGVHFIDNRGHVAGVSGTRLVGGAALTYRFGGRVHLP